MIWLTILAMMAIVFSSRYLFLEPKLPLKLSKKTQHFLSYSAPAVLTAILTPIIFIRDDSLSLSLDNPYLISGAVALILAIITRNTLLTTIISMALFFILKAYI